MGDGGKPKKLFIPITTRRLTVAQAMKEMNHIIDTATEYEHMNCLAALEAEFKDSFRKSMSVSDMDNHIDQIAEEKKLRIVEIVREKNMQSIKAHAKMVS